MCDFTVSPAVTQRAFHGSDASGQPVREHPARIGFVPFIDGPHRRNFSEGLIRPLGIAERTGHPRKRACGAAICPSKHVVLRSSALSLLLVVSAAGSSLRAQSYLDEFGFQPLDDDGYLQAWNVNFQGSGFFIYINYIIGNAGPGSMNNGVNVLLLNGGKQRVWVDERAQESLRAVKGRFGHASGPSELSRENGTIKAKVEVRDLKLDLVLQPIAPAVRLSAGEIRVNSNGGFIRADVPVASATAKGIIVLDGKEIPLQGIAGMEYLRTNHLPHSYAKRFVLTRTYSAGRGFYLGGFYGTSSFPGGQYIMMTAMQKGELQPARRIEKVEGLDPEKDPLSGYMIPKKTVYHITGPDPCTITEQRMYPTGGLYILGHISALLRWVLSVFFTKPYVLHFATKIQSSCGDAASPRLESYDAETTYYLLND